MYIIFLKDNIESLHVLFSKRDCMYIFNIYMTLIIPEYWINISNYEFKMKATLFVEIVTDNVI